MTDDPNRVEVRLYPDDPRLWVVTGDLAARVAATTFLDALNPMDDATLTAALRHFLALGATVVFPPQGEAPR
jgi:hypothetical protein